MAHLLHREASAKLTPPTSLPHLPSLINPTTLSPFFRPSLLPLPLPLSTESRRLEEAMKIIMNLRPPFFGSSKKKTRSVSRSEDSSFGSNASSEDSQSTPKSVLPPLPGLPPLAAAAKSSSTGGDERCPSSSMDYSPAERKGEGRITRRELEVVLRHLGPDPPTEEEVVAMLAEADRTGDGSIRLEEIVALGSAFGPTVAPELRETFAIFDADGDGKISAEELLAMFVTLGDERCTLEDCRRMIGVVDSDGDGFVCYDDFVRMMDGQR